jgi:hypothetical protein
MGERGDWMPIETAPRDGTRILTWDGIRVREVSWWDAWYGDERIPGWMIANSDEEYGHYVNATHWMPLPSPPPRSGASLPDGGG